MKWREELPLIASGMAGALALAVSTYNVYLQRAQVQAQVWPHLEWTYSNNDEGFSWRLENVGTGPALVKAVRVRVDGKPVSSTIEAVNLLWPELTTTKGVSIGYSNFDGRVIPAGATMQPLRLSQLPPTLSPAGEMGRFSVELCYCSTLGDCWLRAAGAQETSVGKCPTYPHYF